MLNHLQTETLAYDRQQNFLAEAEARRLTKLLAPSHSSSHPHPFLAWVGQRLIEWGKQLRSETATPTFSMTPTSVTK
jgi:hypothetical protein